MVLVCTAIDDMITDTQRKQRLTGIGGSDAAAACGLSKYKTPLQLYLEKIGEAQDDAWINERVHFGNLVEDVIANEYARRTERKLRRSNKTIRHPKHKHMIAHPDRMIIGEKRILECKNVGEDYARSDHWGEPGSDQVPMPYLIQCHHYMVVLGYPVCDLAALMGGNRMPIYTIEYDPEMAEALIDKEADFWAHVEKRDPPDPITHDDIEMLYPIDDGADLVVVHNVDPVCAQIETLRDMKAQAKQVDADIKDIIKEIKITMAGNSRIRNKEGVLCTWKKSKDTKHFNETKFAREFPELYSMYQETKPGTRRFVVNAPKAKAENFADNISETLGGKTT